jgi:hypothetical protein
MSKSRKIISILVVSRWIFEIKQNNLRLHSNFTIIKSKILSVITLILFWFRDIWEDGENDENYHAAI